MSSIPCEPVTRAAIRPPGSDRLLVAAGLLLAACGSGGADAPDAGVDRTMAPVGRLHAEGSEIVDARGTPVVLRGANLGAWLFVETWMDMVDYPPHGRLIAEADRISATLGTQVRAAVTAAGRLEDESRAEYYDRVASHLPVEVDAAQWATARAAALACADVADDSDVPLRAALLDRFGAEGRAEILDVYAAAWIDEGDIAALAERGANLVRIPTTWRAWIEDDHADPPALPLTLRPNTVAQVNQLLDWCEAHGLRAIVDLQESPGGHNTYSGPAHLYDDPAAQEATIALWRAIATELRDRDSVAAYSLLAEPFGAPDVDAMIAMYDRLYDALRGDGDGHLLVIHDGFFGLASLPPPTELGWTDVVYSTHYFEWEAGSASDYQTYAAIMRATNDQLQQRGPVPFYVGSFSTMRDQPWAYDAFDLLTELFADQGWSWSVWSWKRIDDPLDRELFGESSAWGVFRDFADGESPVRIDVCHDDLETIVNAVAGLATDHLAVNPALDAGFRAGLARPTGIARPTPR